MGGGNMGLTDGPGYGNLPQFLQDLIAERSGGITPDMSQRAPAMSSQMPAPMSEPISDPFTGIDPKYAAMFSLPTKGYGFDPSMFASGAGPSAPAPAAPAATPQPPAAASPTAGGFKNPFAGQNEWKPGGGNGHPGGR